MTKAKAKPRCRGGLKGARCILSQGHRGNHHIKWDFEKPLPDSPCHPDRTEDWES